MHRAIEANRNLPLTHFILASALALQGKTNEALAATKAGLAIDPGFTIQRFRNNPLSDNPSYLANRTGPGPVPPTGKSTRTDYVYVMQFTGDKISHMTKIWHSGLALKELGWA